MAWRHRHHDEIIALDEQGVSRSRIADVLGIGERQVRRSLERARDEREVYLKGKTEAVTIDWNSLPTKAQEREAVMRRVIRKELEAEFEPRVQAEVQRRVEGARKRMATAEANARRVLESRKGIFTRDEHNAIRSCLHPDSRESATPEKLATAFRLFNEAELVFLNENDFPTRSATLPSMDELMKRRRERRRA